MARDLNGEQLDEWLEESKSCKVSALGISTGQVCRQLEEVSPVGKSGLTERWSNGPVEGFVHILKLVKCQDYGRADFDLLRARVLDA